MDMPARLDAIETCIREGAEKTATDELRGILDAGDALAPFDRLDADALASFDRIVGICLTLNEPSLIDTFMERVASELDAAQRIRLEFKVVDACIAKNMRRDAFRQLQKIVPLAQGQFDELRKAAEILSRIGEDSFAAEIFRQLSKLNPGDIAIERGFIRSAIFSGQPGSLERLETFLGRKGMTVSDWEYAVEIFKNQFNQRQVVRCARQALALGGDPVKNRISLAQAWFQLHRKTKMAAEIKKIPLDKIEDAWGVRNLCHLAIAAEDSALAARIAEVQWNRDKDTPFSTLFYLNFLIMNNNLEKGRLIADHIFALIEKNGKRMADKEFVRLAEICFKTFNSDGLEMRAIELGLKQYPDNGPLTTVKRQHEARQRFVVSHGAGGRTGAKSSAGLLNRLRRRLGGNDTPIT